MIRRNCDCVPTVFCRGYFFGCFFLLGFTGFFFTVGSLVRTSPSRGHKSVDCGKNCCDTPPYWSTTTGYFFFQKKNIFFLTPNSNRFRHFAAELRAFLFLLLFCFVFQFFFLVTKASDSSRTSTRFVSFYFVVFFFVIRFHRIFAGSAHLLSFSFSVHKKKEKRKRK